MTTGDHNSFSRSFVSHDEWQFALDNMGPWAPLEELEAHAKRAPDLAAGRYLAGYVAGRRRSLPADEQLREDRDFNDGWVAGGLDWPVDKKPRVSQYIDRVTGPGDIFDADEDEA